LADPQWRGDLEVTADSALDTAVLLNASDRQSMILKGRTAVVRMGRSGDDELVLRTTDPLTKLIVNVTAGAEFAVAVGDNDVKTGTEFSIALDPSSEEYPKPGVDVAGKNALRIWYVAPTAKRSAAKTLSEDVVEELRALGYTGD
jgi:hypothetical protein